MGIVKLGLVSLMISVSFGTATIIDTGLDEKINAVIKSISAEDKSKLSASIDKLSNSINKISEDEELRSQLKQMIALENADSADMKRNIARQIATSFEGNGGKPASLDSIINSSIDINSQLEEVGVLREEIMSSVQQYL